MACVLASAQEARPREELALSDGSVIQLSALEIEVPASARRGSVNGISLRAAVRNTSSNELHLNRVLLDAAFNSYGRFQDASGVQWEIRRLPVGSHVTPRMGYFKEFVSLAPGRLKWIDLGLFGGDPPLAPINADAFANDHTWVVPAELQFSIFAPVYLEDPERPDRRTPIVMSGSCAATVTRRTNATARAYEPRNSTLGPTEGTK